VSTRPIEDGLRHGSWELTLDDTGRPIGWIDRSAGSALLPAATYRPVTDTLRSALDAAVLSPAGVAVAVDAEGRATGTATREAVLDALSATVPATVPAAVPAALKSGAPGGR
jgi:osmoprotectant transport system ATP-binding protein